MTAHMCKIIEYGYPSTKTLLDWVVISQKLLI